MMDSISHKYPSSLPDFSSAANILLASDYSGEHPGATYQVLSFLLADLSKCGHWNDERIKLREQFLSDKRRMSFKALRDNKRAQALPYFLMAADNIPGLCFSVAIDNSIKTLFDGVTPLDLQNPEFEEFRTWSKNALEKSFRVVHFLSFLIAGLLQEKQNILWFTDEDSIAANDSRLIQLTKLFSWISTIYLTFDLGNLRCGTTKSDDGSRMIEDVCRNTRSRRWLYFRTTESKSIDRYTR